MVSFCAERLREDAKQFFGPFRLFENAIGIHMLYGKWCRLAHIFKDEMMNDRSHGLTHSRKIPTLRSFKYIDEVLEALDAWGKYPALINVHLCKHQTKETYMLIEILNPGSSQLLQWDNNPIIP